MDSYSAAKIEQLDRTATHRVYGRALEFDLGDAARRWRPVFPCLCVQDSPDNPCPCPPGPIWWLRTDTILAEGDSGRKDADGNELRYFDVFLGSQFLVESMQSVTLKKRGGTRRRGKISPSPVGGITDGITDAQGGGGLGSIAIMGWDDILIGLAISLAAGLLIEGGKAILDGGGGGDGGDRDQCYDVDSDSFYYC
jgi:hypothetical protein